MKFNYPEGLKNTTPINARLAIKSSFPNAKRNIALLYLLWFCNDKKAQYDFYNQVDDKVKIKDEYLKPVFNKTKNLVNLKTDGDLYQIFKNEVNSTELVKSQIESLQVAFELVWCLADITFVDKSFSNVKERTGGKRYPKSISFTSNMDLINYAFLGQERELMSVLTKWLFEKSKLINYVNTDSTSEQLASWENKLLDILSLISENTAFGIKIPSVDKHLDLIFKKEGIYRSIVEHHQENVNIIGDSETKGPLRILLTMLKQNMEPYLKDTGKKGIVSLNTSNISAENILNYAQRINTNFKLSKVDLTNSDESEHKQKSNIESCRFGGKNIIFYGAPGTGKSYGIEKYIRDHGIEEYSAQEGNEKVFRITLYPEYTYSDFVGQLMPVVKNIPNSNEKQITYDFQEGIFTLALKYAFYHKEEPVFLVLEEMSRSNVASVFGDLFQLLDRNSEGTSEYAINNELLATKALGKDPSAPVQLPRNLTILGTVNTSDQNVFAMDTAFKRRFEWRYVSTKVNVENFDNNPLLHIIGVQRDISWKDFFYAINNFIVNDLHLGEDKQIGPYFIKFSKDISVNNNLIRNKLLQYLWEDVENIANMRSDKRLFDESIRSFSDLYDKYPDTQVFSDEFLSSISNGDNELNND